MSIFSRHKLNLLSGLIALAAGAGSVSAARAAQPVDWQMGFQPAASPNMEYITWFHDVIMLPLMIGIVVLVFALLAYVVVKFNEKANPVPSKTTHHTLIEVVWTIVPVLILVLIAIPSFRLLYFQRDFPPVDMTIKATGLQWYWSYQYPDHGEFEFDSILVEDEDLKPGQPRLLSVDNQVVVPVGKVVRVIVTADPSDVIHNWAMPAFGVKMDAIPGRLNETWFKADREGVYYGQCSELCGIRHAYMPIAVRVVSEADFEKWVKLAQEDLESSYQMFADKDASQSDDNQLASTNGETANLTIRAE